MLLTCIQCLQEMVKQKKKHNRAMSAAQRLCWFVTVRLLFKGLDNRRGNALWRA